MKKQGLQSHRLHKLLTSSPLIRKRAEGWLTGDPDRRFKEKCQVLRDYVELHKRLPKSTGGPNAASSKLAEWLANVRKQRWQLSLNPYQVRMLQEVHPLVKAEVKRWQNIPLSMDRPRWEQRLEGALQLCLSVRMLAEIQSNKQGREEVLQLVPC